MTVRAALEGAWSNDEPLSEAAPAWKIALSGVLTLIGLGIAIYLTIVHYVGTQALVCPSNGVFSCLAVQTSPESWFPPNWSLHPGFLHIPIAVLGLFFFTVLVPLNSPWAWRSTNRRLHIARLAVLGIGLAFALYLVSAELVILGKICEWCTAEHIVTFILFVLTMSAVPRMLGWGEGARD